MDRTAREHQGGVGNEASIARRDRDGMEGKWHQDVAIVPVFERED